MTNSMKEMCHRLIDEVCKISKEDIVDILKTVEDNSFVLYDCESVHVKMKNNKTMIITVQTPKSPRYQQQ